MYLGTNFEKEIRSIETGVESDAIRYTQDLDSVISHLRTCGGSQSNNRHFGIFFL